MSFDFNSDSQQQVPDMLPPKEGIGAFTIIGLVSFVLLGTGWLCWSSITSAARSALARQDARAARASTEAKDWSRAYELLAKARSRAPADPEVMRARIDFLKVTGHDPGGLVQQLHEFDSVNPLEIEDQLLLGNTLVSMGKVAEARRVLERITPAADAQASSLELLSKILKTEGHEQEASVILRRAQAWKNHEPEARLNAALEDLQSVFPELRRQARSQLWELARLPTAPALRATQELAASTSLTLKEAQELRTLADAHPHKDLTTHLSVISALMRIQPENRATLVREEVQRFKSGSHGTMKDIAVWLMREHEHEEILKLVPLSLAEKSRELYPVMIQTLVQQRRWKELEEMLSVKRPPVDKGLVNVALADLKAHLLPDKLEARSLLEGSIASARVEGNLPVLKAAAMAAEKLNFLDLATSALMEAADLSKAAGGSEEAVSELQKAAKMAMGARDTASLLNVFRKLHEMRPSSQMFADQFTYLRLVLGVEMETVDVSRLVTESQSTSSALGVTLERVPPDLLLALAAYRLGDVASMRRLLERFHDTSGLSAGQRAVAAGLLSLAGRPDRAFQIAEQVPSALLLDEEIVFLKKAL